MSRKAPATEVVGTDPWIADYLEIFHDQLIDLVALDDLGDLWSRVGTYLLTGDSSVLDGALEAPIPPDGPDVYRALLFDETNPDDPPRHRGEDLDAEAFQDRLTELREFVLDVLREDPLGGSLPFRFASQTASTADEVSVTTADVGTGTAKAGTVEAAATTSPKGKSPCGPGAQGKNPCQSEPENAAVQSAVASIAPAAATI